MGTVEDTILFFYIIWNNRIINYKVWELHQKQVHSVLIESLRDMGKCGRKDSKTLNFKF